MRDSHPDVGRLRATLNSSAGLTARRVAGRAARRVAPDTADRVAAELRRAVREHDARQHPADHPHPHRARRIGAALTVLAALGGSSLAEAGPALAVTAASRPAASGADTAGEAGSSASSAPTADVAIPQVYPRPQSVQPRGAAVPVPRTVTVVAGPGADPGALDAVRSTLRAAGARTVDVVPQAPAHAPAGTLTVVLGGSAAELRALGAAAPDGLPPGGYALAAGQAGGADRVVLAGADSAGAFYAAQTLRQLVTAVPGGASGHGFPGVVIRDYPSTPVRGTVEGFYGTPWTAQQRLDTLDFLARTKQNRYLYAPGDDPYRQAQWRSRYPAQQEDRFRQLASAADRDHITLGYALSPGQDVCYSSAADASALAGKLARMWELGFRAFQLQFANVSYSEWHCGGDQRAFGSGPQAAAQAQATLVNAVLQRLAAEHPAAAAAAPLSVLPTEYFQSGSTPYRTALVESLDPSVQVAWTGDGVVPKRITESQLADARAAFGGRQLITQDNYPVNDSAQDRLYLGPYTGRAPGVATGSAELLVNAMEQPVASRIPLFTAADYAWNPDHYQAQDSWQAAIRALGGGDRSTGALDLLAENDASGPLGGAESAYLRPLLNAFWSALEPTAAVDPSGPGNSAAVARQQAESAQSVNLDDAARQLRSAFDAMAQAPEELADVLGGALSAEDGPWLDQLARYGQAGRSAVDMLVGQRTGDGRHAWTDRVTLRQLAAQLAQSPATVAAGVLDPFLKRALAASDSWTGLGGASATPTTTLGTAQNHDPALMTDGDQSTFYWSDAPPQPGDAVGVDLGSEQPVGRVRIQMGGPGANPAGGSSGNNGINSDNDADTANDTGSGALQADPDAAADDSAAADDYLHDAALEYSTGDGGWHQLAVYHGQKTITAAFPAGTAARYVRLRALSAQDNAVAVREFTVTAPDAPQPTASGGPAAVPGSSAADVVDGDPDTAYRAAAAPAAGDALTVSLGASRPLDRVVVLTDPTVRAKASVEVHEAGKGWVRIGALADGYTELRADGRTRADQVRLAWQPGSPPPVVYEVVPWYADAAPAQLRLPQPSVDVQIGGAAATLDAELSAAGAAGASGTVSARPPQDAKGLSAQGPGAVAVARGGQLTVPLRFSAARGITPGTYTVPVEFRSGDRTVRQEVQVRAYPKTGGPDLARIATATASGTETPQFPASDVNDGDPSTRWSSPASDDQWIQLELPDAEHLGEAVLHWQDAYAARYRIETSPDGVHWTTAALVQDGQGGTETVRFDAPDARYVRMQGVQRATRYGYSLYGMELYAVTS